MANKLLLLALAAFLVCILIAGNASAKTDVASYGNSNQMQGSKVLIYNSSINALHTLDVSKGNAKDNPYLLTVMPTDGFNISINMSDLNSNSSIVVYNDTGLQLTNALYELNNPVYTFDITNTTNEQNVTVSFSYSANGIYNPKIAPYILTNDTWTEIKNFINNQTTDTLTFQAPSDPTYTVDNVPIQAPNDNSGISNLTVYCSVALTASASGTLQTISMNINTFYGTPPTAQAALYTDSGGFPGAFITNSVETLLTTTGYDPLTMLGSATINMGANYHLCFDINNDGGRIALNDYYSDSNERETPNSGGVGHPPYIPGNWPAGSALTASRAISWNLSMTYITGGYISPTVTITPTSSQIDLGQSQMWTANVMNGLPLFSYNWQVYNSIGLVTNILYTGLGTTNSFTYTPSMPGTYSVNVVVMDSHPTTVNSLTSTLVVIPVNQIFCNGGIPTNIVNATPFQNVNTSTLVLLSDSQNQVQGYYANTVDVQEIVNQSGTNSSTTLPIPPLDYGQYNFKTPTNFHCQWLASSGGGSTNSISTPSSTTSISVALWNHILFVLTFVGALVFIILFLITLPGDLKSESLRPLFLLLFGIALWIATMPAFLAPENIVNIAYPTYNVISGAQTTTYPSYNAIVTQKLQVRAYNSYFYIWLGILTFLFFLLLLWYALTLRAKTARLLKEGRDTVEGFERNH